jgi:hypothetical protein
VLLSIAFILHHLRVVLLALHGHVLDVTLIDVVHEGIGVDAVDGLTILRMVIRSCLLLVILILRHLLIKIIID